jgi:membrane associated rhomboid family serine protease
MPPSEGWFSIALTIGMAFTTRQGLVNPDFKARMGFDPVLVRNPSQWYRYITCAFVHHSWWSYAANALILLWSGRGLEQNGIAAGGVVLAVYFLSLWWGTWMHSRIGRGHLLTVVGSGAGTSGVFLMQMLAAPQIEPLNIPTWLFATVFFIIAVQRPGGMGGLALLTLGACDLFGSACGAALSLALTWPQVSMHPINAGYLAFLLALSITWYLRNPLNLPVEDTFRLSRWRRSAPRPPPATIPNEEVDRLLDKIAAEGLQSLSTKERKYLEQASRDRRGK